MPTALQTESTSHRQISPARVNRSARNPSPLRRPVKNYWSALRWSALLLALTLSTPLVHGYHPLAEDGGLYVAGVELSLNPSLFPRFTEFVSEHLQFSVFAPAIAAITRVTHLPLLAILLAINLLSIALALTAARAVLRRITPNERSQFAGIATFAAVWTVPIAGTSLLLMDPYVTARSFSTPLSLWAIAFALDNWKSRPRSLIRCVLAIALAAAFHPLMAGYALGLIVVLRTLESRRRMLLLTVLAVLIFAGAAVLQLRSPAESGAVILAAKSRYYWFLSQWHWYEIFGLVGPILVLLALRHRNQLGLGANAKKLCTAAILYGCFATILTLLFAQEQFHAHTVARLQPLRAFLMIYLVMFLLLGASLQQLFERAFARSSTRRFARYAMLPILLASALGMFVTQRNAFPESAHIEFPWRLQQNSNPWVRAFLWCRDNTPQSALFALDSHYITTPGEDAQTLRATAQRSALPDFSKDGGEAAITPHLAEEWAAGFTAQLDMDQQTAAQLRERLASYGVDWVILRSDSPAALTCPYDNNLLKVCKL
jgi:hypothetical protein